MSEDTEVQLDVANPNGEILEGEVITEEKQEGENLEAPQETVKKENPTQHRIDELTRARREAEREAQYWQQRALGNEKPAETQLQEPKIEDFEDPKEFIKAATKYAIQEEKKALDAERANEAAAKVHDAKAQTWQERQNSVRESIADYDEVVGTADIPVQTHVRDALLDSEKGPELVYHFAKNPDVLDRLNNLSPVQAAIEIGRLEAKLTTPAAAPKPISNAPPPIKPVGSGRTNAAQDPSTMTNEQYRAYRAKQGASWAR